MEKRQKREIRHERVRRKVIGTKEKPRLSVYRSLRHFYAQLIDDVGQKTLFSLSTLNTSLRKKVEAKKGMDVVAELGKQFAKDAASKGFKKVVLDRGGYPYHGKLKAFAEACRENGLSF